VRVLYFSRDYTPHDHRFLAAAAEAGHEVAFLRMERRATRRESRPLPEGVEEIRWRGGQGPIGWWDWPGLWLDLRRVLAKHQPDLVHAGPVQRCAFLTALAGFHPLVTMSWGSDLLVGAERGAGRWAAEFALSRSEVFIADCQTVARAGY
jgi:hypothetical protein